MPKFVIIIIIISLGGKVEHTFLCVDTELHWWCCTCMALPVWVDGWLSRICDVGAISVILICIRLHKFKKIWFRKKKYINTFCMNNSFYMNLFLVSISFLWKKGCAPASLGGTDWNEKLVLRWYLSISNHGDYSHDSCCGKWLKAYRSTCNEMATIK